MDSIYLQPYSYISYDVSGNPFVWPAVLRPSGATVGGKRVTLHQAVKSTKGWVEGSGEMILVPVNLTGVVDFDDEADANNFIASAIIHLESSKGLVRLEKEGPLVLGASSLVADFNGERGNQVTLNLTFMPEDFPIYQGRKVTW